MRANSYVTLSGGYDTWKIAVENFARAALDSPAASVSSSVAPLVANRTAALTARNGAARP
jgi:hypothetical protein